MNNFSISFGKKIPIAQCHVLDKSKDKFVPATFYELDCQDFSDIEEIKNLDGKWAFQYSITQNMMLKYTKNKFSSQPEDETENFYILQKDNGKVLGITQVSSYNKNIEVDYIETAREHRYKYAGQSMLAALGMKLLQDDGDKLIIGAPTDSARPFYTEKCGFKDYINNSLKMDAKHIKKFIRKTRKKTKSPIRDLRA